MSFDSKTVTDDQSVYKAHGISTCMFEVWFIDCI